MLKTLHELMESLLPMSPAAQAQASEHALQLATAVMLTEVMRADGRFEPSERDAVHSALCETFTLTDEEAATLAQHARSTAKQATDLISFTSLVDAHFEMPQKLRMVELMWRVAYADGHLSEYGLGSVSETADGDAPHEATGCPFQAWSVAELLRARRAV
jgi:uncharacterized tellurite resistance protein B-like protein